MGTEHLTIPRNRYFLAISPEMARTVAGKGCVRSNETVSHGVGDGCAPGMHAQFAANMFDVRRCRAQADEEGCSDFAI
jgi:hypothetical protein